MFASTKKTKASSSSSSSSSLKSSSFTPATTTTMTSSSSSTSSPSPSSSSSGSKRSIELYFWNILGSSVAVLFGEECAAAACWTILVLTIRCILYCTYLEPYVPYGLIYALPVLVELCTPYVPLFKRSFPILSVRIAECFLGKVNPTRMLILIPAHLLGSIFGAVALKMIFPFLPSEVLRPLVFPSHNVFMTFFIETANHFFYCLILLVLPYLFDINRINSKWILLPLLPILIVPYCTLNPGLTYALWYLRNCCILINARILHMERIAGAIAGAVLAGWVCNVYFPDDPKAWTRLQTRMAGSQ